MDWGVVGHEWAVQLLQQAVEEGELSHAYLFTGPEGVGKGTLARALASALFCEGYPRPCGACRACRLVAAGHHPDLLWVGPATEKGHISIEQIRELQRILSLTPNLARHRLVVLDRFEQATASAANAFLKTLEEPPDYAVLILLAPEADALLPTIVSRCQIVALRPLPARRVEEALIVRWQVDPDRARLLARLCGGRLGWAVRAATDPAILQRREQRLQELLALTAAPLTDRFRYAAELARDPEETREALDLWLGWWRDVLLVSSGVDEEGAGEFALTNLDRRAQLEQFAARFSPAQAAARIRAIRTALDRLQRNANPLLTLEVLLGFDL
ncbi:MAG: DNA polymerase III subunit delta' [Anaerolineae bacterium]|nr:DNA polymerase III subunit delta' [Anaerolineae bacterium]